ncbi:MAG: hypothetical protein JXM70_22500 [Pirellulales bacterium]|nr:hypothetical protein [Pirellulales bacterium]
MGLFTVNQERAVQSEILNLVNNNCPSVKAMAEGPRVEQRVNLTIPVKLVPILEGELAPLHTLSVVTKEFSSGGFSVVVDHPHVPKDAVVLFRSGRKTTFIQAQLRHIDPIGAGFYQCGFKLLKVLAHSDWPTLQELAETL